MGFRGFDFGPAVGKNGRRSDGMDFGEWLGVSAGRPCVGGLPFCITVLHGFLQALLLKTHHEGRH